MHVASSMCEMRECNNYEVCGNLITNVEETRNLR